MSPSTQDSTATQKSTALVIGASRGLGLALAREYAGRGWTVIGTVRGAKPTALHEVAGVEVEQLDIDDAGQIKALRQRLEGRSVDLLFVNAGVGIDPSVTIADTTTDDFVRVMTTNALSPMRVVETLQDLVPATGTIAVMSSVLGSVGDNDSGGYEVYRGSKAALNTFMRSFAARQAGGTRTLALVHPGWVRTDLGGPNAPLDAPTSVAGIAEALAAHRGKPGLHFFDYQGATVRW